MRTPISLAGVTAVFASLTLTGCSYGHPLSREEAPTFLAKHRAALENIVKLVQDCRPVSEGSNHTLWTNPEDQNKPSHCETHLPSGIEHLRAALKQLNLPHVRHFGLGPASKSEDARYSSVSIGVYSDGLMISGTSTTLTYYFKARDEAHTEQHLKTGALYSEEQAITPPPHHWYWELQN
ncbi:hypothetical protein BH11PSE1_BH11PSE1_09240 [soil metagenome]